MQYWGVGRKPDTPSESQTAAPKGVMDASYAEQRRLKPHLAFRFHSRALIASRTFQRLSSQQTPTIVDLGSADGATMAVLHQQLKARQSTGIEYSQELIDSAGRMPDGCRLLRGDVTRADPLLKGGGADLVTALAILEHLSEPLLVLQQARRVLKPGGLLIATAPAGAWDSISGAAGLHKEEHHELQFTRALFESLAHEANLEPILYQRFMFAPIAFLPYLRIPVGPGAALTIDYLVARLRVLNWLFVNQLFVARKPA